MIGLPKGSDLSATTLLLRHPSLFDDLSAAYQGNYAIILSLLGCLDRGGREVKRLVDEVIDNCE